ncbi:MAG TPA: DUF222 domain-containing protein [Marmoricola sp.]|nr:DUF222 domain-containing protein [Marmoricola sp.]
MSSTGILEHLAEPDVLLEAEVMRRIEREAQCRVLQAAVEWGHLNDAAHFHPDTAIDGSEKLVRLGGEATPAVAEFAPAALAGRLGYSPYTARTLMADGLDLCHRLPATWARVCSFEAIASYARMLARKTRELTVEQAGRVDAQIARYVDGRVGYTKLEDLIDAAIKRVDRDAAREREEAAARRRFVKTTRAWEGTQGLYLRADVAAVTMVMNRVNHLAGVLGDLGDTRDLDTRRVTAMLFLANPSEALKLLRRHHDRDHMLDRPTETTHSAAEPVVDEAKLLPTVWLIVHLLAQPDTQPDAQPDDDGEVARVEGAGPVTPDWVRVTLGEHARFKITPVLDPLGQAPVTSYEIPERHRQAVHILTPADTYPYATSTSRRQQIDHTQEWCPTCSKAAADGVKSTCRCGGYSGIGNYGPMKTFHHRIKTHSPGVDVKQPFPGIYLWRDTTGQHYLVDNTGTRALDKDAADERPSIRLLAMEVYRDTEVAWAA